jgi:hypothetical protein
VIWRSPVRVFVRAGICGLAALLLACGSEPDVATPPEPTRAAGESTPIAGLYEVKGSTTVLSTGDERAISGKVILAREGDRYTSTFSLHTIFPASDGGMRHTDVTGKGEGIIEGNVIRGNAETQLMMAAVHGIDSKFPFLPRTFGPRIASTTVATIEPDGTITIEIQSKQAGDQVYPPTRTTLRGARVDPRTLRPAGAPVIE